MQSFHFYLLDPPNIKKLGKEVSNLTEIYPSRTETSHEVQLSLKNNWNVDMQNNSGQN